MQQIRGDQHFMDHTPLSIHHLLPNLFTATGWSRLLRPTGAQGLSGGMPQGLDTSVEPSASLRVQPVLDLGEMWQQVKQITTSAY